MAWFNCKKAHRRPQFLMAVAAALVLATAAAPVPAAAQAPAPGQPPLDQSPSVSPGPPPRSPFPGFILTHGRYIPFEAPDPNVLIVPLGINNRGEIVGEYIRPASESGMLRDRRGRITSFDVPGARGTEGVDINDRGQIVGTYSQDTSIVNDSARPRGYLLDRGKLTRIDYPGAKVTVALGVNNRRQVVGQYVDAQGKPHGYMWKDGRFTTIDVPGATVTAPVDINDRGEIAGIFSNDPIDPTGLATSARGFLLSAGVYHKFAAPRVPFTAPKSLNNRGQIVGFTAVDAVLTDAHGFLLAKGAKGPFTPIDVPGAPRTIASGINDLGQIIGRYENPDVAPSVAGQEAPDGMVSAAREPAALAGVTLGSQLSSASP
jgi:probable HAF family extracellular repeat protein